MMLVLMVVNFVAAGLFLTGLINVSSVSSLYVTFPLGAIFYGLFLIVHLLEKEVAAFDAEHYRHQNEAKITDQSAGFSHDMASHAAAKA